MKVRKRDIPQLYNNSCVAYIRKLGNSNKNKTLSSQLSQYRNNCSFKIYLHSYVSITKNIYWAEEKNKLAVTLKSREKLSS